MRLIDADALIEKIRSLWKTESSTEQKSVKWECAVAYAVILVLSVIVEMKPIEAEPVRHGRWIDGRPYTNSRWKVCSECHKSAHHPAGGDAYCPNCGAKMDGGD